MGGVPLRQVRQEADSEVRGLKVQEGESSSSSQQFQCAILPSRIEGVKKRKKKKEAHNDEWLRIKKTRNGRRGGFLSLMKVCN